MSSISHSITVTRSPAPVAGLKVRCLRLPLFTDEHAQHVWRHRIVAIAGAVADAFDLHRGNRAERRGVGRRDQRAGRRHQFFLHRAAVNRRIAEYPDRRRRRHGKHAVRRMDHAAADVQRRADDAVRAGPLHREHGTDDVDDRVERADLVQVDLLHRHLMDRRFRFAEPLEHGLGALAPRGRQRRPVDHVEDLWQVPVRVRLGGRGRVRGAWFRVEGTLVHRELRRRNAGAQDLFRAQFHLAQREAAEGVLQIVERQAGVEQRAERHVARDPRKTVEVQNPAHRCPTPLMLQNRASPSTT